MGATIGGQYTESADRPRQRVISDPTAVLSLSRDPDFDGQPVFSSIGPSADPLAVAEAIGMRERRLVAYAGLNPADVQRASGDPRSGYSLAITREGQREAQRRYGPIFRSIDEEVLSLSATAIRIGGGPIIAEDGWSVTHQLLPASPDERDAERKDVLELLSVGLLSPAEARARLLGETMVEAEAALARLRCLPWSEKGRNHACRFRRVGAISGSSGPAGSRLS
ncbi:MAG: hypothetical protein EBX64_05010 [Betaproteobacteria bacterium]|nr:hypothetical protein [Betaproteobacteria bacterium]